jgi:cytochrome c oxidase subunit 4
MSNSHPETIQHEIKRYRSVGLWLFAGTVITVAAAYFDFGIVTGIIVALIIASVKGTLVAGYFMHLFHERKFVYQVLVLTAVFIIVMVGLIMFTYGDQQGVNHGPFKVPQKHVPTAPGAH